MDRWACAGHRHNIPQWLRKGAIVFRIRILTPRYIRGGWASGRVSDYPGGERATSGYVGNWHLASVALAVAFGGRADMAGRGQKRRS